MPQLPFCLPEIIFEAGKKVVEVYSVVFKVIKIYNSNPHVTFLDFKRMRIWCINRKEDYDV